MDKISFPVLVETRVTNGVGGWVFVEKKARPVFTIKDDPDERAQRQHANWLVWLATQDLIKIQSEFTDRQSGLCI
jgi:hypothetical protein